MYFPGGFIRCLVPDFCCTEKFVSFQQSFWWAFLEGQIPRFIQKDDQDNPMELDILKYGQFDIRKRPFSWRRLSNSPTIAPVWSLRNVFEGILKIHNKRFVTLTSEFSSLPVFDHPAPEVYSSIEWTRVRWHFPKWTDYLVALLGLYVQISPEIPTSGITSFFGSPIL